MTVLIPDAYMAKASAFIRAHGELGPISMVALAMVEAEQSSAGVRVGLTHQQLALLEFIAAYEQKHGVGPTFDEMREHLGLASKSGVHRLVHALVERGAVVRLPNRWRAISAVRRAA